jgi:deoxyuridine 5'-triphosphate nucleotidohydrolase
MKLQAKKLHTEATLPTRGHTFDAGLDLYALSDVYLPMGTTGKVPTGISINVPQGYYAQIKDRSSMAVKSLIVGAGVIDHGYTGELVVIIHNFNNISHQSGYMVKAGDKVAQVILHKIELPEVEEVEAFEETERGNKGFGSTGV